MLTDDSGMIGVIVWSNAHKQARKTEFRVQMETVILGRRPGNSSTVMGGEPGGSVYSRLTDVSINVEVYF